VEENLVALTPSPVMGTKVFHDVDVCARFFALTPSPSPTAWERGAKRVRSAG